ncbi:GmrSD restriction endonuclease domain-containing protein [Glycomyces endophyticus]
MRLYKDTTYSVHHLVEDIRNGRLALPELQRPFVWNTTQVRNLFDSMYRGYPVGYLLFWATGADSSRRGIGENDAERAAQLIIDGQQRTTAIYAVLTGREVLKKDYTRTRITIAFRPTDATFEVANAATRNDPEFVNDISRVFAPGYDHFSETTAFIARLVEHREVSVDEQGRIARALHQLQDLAKADFKVIELSASAGVEEVSEIFVRINSAGTELNRSDFLLTLMSVYWEEGRRDLERFCADTRVPRIDGQPSPFNWHLHPKPVALLRADFALAFRRARLESVYTLLSGRDMPEGPERAKRIDEQFRRLSEAQDKVLNLLHWHEFLQCLELAGFRGQKMITSDNAVVFAYVMWLIGRIDFKLPIDRLRHLVARWFFMAHTTSRYSGSFETQVERDLSQISGLKTGDAEGFENLLGRLIDERMTSDWWTVTLPGDLETSASRSPVLSAYIAALNILDADALLSKVKVRSRLDPSIKARKGIERHHLFPQNYLKSTLKVQETRKINQIANMALVEWADNIAVSDRPPAEYWPTQVQANRLSQADLDRHVYWHALPEGWTDMPYGDFLAQRRRLMAGVVKDAFERLAKDDYLAVYPEPTGTVPETTDDLADLIAEGLVVPGESLLNETDQVQVTVLADGRLDLDGAVYDGPDDAARVAAGAARDAWTYWSVESPGDGVQTLDSLRQGV